ncbi:uncharacterized protein LOC141907271 [Tubulanus polymorphus]|uniref:uncharacterized protein LOC141907271 n=1 Tax=Tubulanus polymorphus TaxID=672921 RepID=UPI003DA4BBB7
MDHKIKDGSKSSASRKKKENNNDVHKDGKKLQNGESKLGKDPYAWEDDQSPEPVTLMSEDDRKRHARNKLEKHRKDKIRGFVNQLIDLLPPILTGKKTQNTNEVLERTVNYVKELKGQNEQLMRNNGDEIQAQEIAQLRRDLEKVTNERDHLDKILEQAGMVGLNSSNLMWQKNRQCSMNAERLMKMASAHKQTDDEANTTNNDDVKINNKPKRNRSGGKTLKTHINESQQNSDFVSLATARSLADQISVVTSHAGFELSGNPALVSPSDSASKLSFVDSNGMLMVSPTAAAQSLFSNVETDSTSKNYASSTGEINEEMMDATACDNNDTALQTLASLATSSQILAGSSSNSDVTMMPGAAAASMSQQGAPVSITGTQVTQSVGMPIMSTDPKSGELTSVVGNLGFPQQQQQQQQSAPGINSNIPIPLMQQNTQQNSAASSLQGTLVMQNGQLLLIKDPVMPLQQQQQQQQMVPPDTAATDVSKTGGKDEKDSNVTDQLVASQQQQQQAGMMFPGGLIPRPPLGQSMLNAAGQQIVPLSNGQFGIVNNAQQQSLPPTILGSHLGIQPTNQIPGLVQPPGSLPQALILPNGQVVPVVTQPNLLFPHSQSANNGIIVPGNSGALMQMPPGGAGMMPGMNLLPSASSMAGGLLMTTSVTTVTTSTVASSSCNSSMQVVSSHQMAPISTAAPSQSNATNTATTNSNRLPTTPSQMLPPIGQPMVMNPATGQPQVLVGQPQLLMNQNQLNPIGMNAFAGQNNLAMPIGQSVVPSSVSTGTDPNRKSTPVSTVAMSGNLVNAATASTSVTSGTPPVSTSSGPTTLRVVSSNGTFLITLPPGVNPQNLIIDPNNLAALQQQGKPGMIPQPATTVTGNVPVSGLSTGVGGKNKKGQRVLMPKPPNLGNGAYIPPITVWPMPMQQQQQQLQQQQSQQQTSEKRTNKSRQTTDGVTAATKQTDKSNDKKSNESGSGSVATDETLETDANSDNTPVTTVTEDILAKAAESIFASSMSDISPTIYDNDDNSLYIDTASTAAVTEPQTDESVAAPIAEPVEPPVVATSKKPADKSRSRKKKSKASKEKLKCDSVEIPAATAVEVEKSVETMPCLISEPVYTTPAPLPATDCSKLGVSDEKHEKIISPSKQQQQQQPAPSMPILVPEVTNITNKQMTKQERKEARRLAKKKRAEEKLAAAAAAAANAATVVTPMVKVDADAPVAMETESDSAKENKNETKIAANEDPGQRLVSDGLPDTITFTESELCDVLDQVENLGLTLQPEEPSPPKPPAVVADTTPNKSRGRKNKSSNRDGQPVSKKRKHNNKSSSSSGAGEFDVDVQDDILPNDTGLQIDLDPPSLEINEQYASPGHVVAPGSTVNASPQIPKTSTTETSNESPQIDQQTIDEDDSAEKENSNNVDSFFDSISDMINPSPPPLTAPSLRETRASSTDIDKTTASVDNLETSLNETNLNILSSIAAEASSTLEAMEQLRKSTEDLRMPPDDKQHDHHHRAESPIHMRPDSPMRIPMDTPMPPVCRSPPPRLNSPPQLQSHSMAIDSPSGLPSPPTTHHLPNQRHDNKIVKHSPVHAANNTMLSPPTSIMSPPGQNLVMKSSPASSSYTSMNPSSLQPDSQSPMSQSGGDRHRHESYGSQNMGPSSIDSALSSQHSVPSHGTSNTTALKHQSAQLATHSGLTAPFLSHSAESLFSPASAPSHRKEPMKAQEPYMDTADVPPQQQSAAPSLPPSVTKASPSKSPVRSSAGNITGNHNNNTSANNSKHSRKQQQQSGGLPSAAASQSNYYSTENLLMSNRHPDSMPPGGGMFNQPQAPPPTASANSNMQNNTACGMQRGGNENNFNMQSFMPNIASDSSCTGPFSMASTLPAFSFSLSGTSTSNPNSLPPQFPFYPLHPSISQQGEPPALNMPPFPPQQQQQQQQQDNRNSSIGPPPPRPTKQSNDPHFNNSNYGSTSPRDSMRNARPNQFMEAVAPPTQGKGPQSSANDFTAMNHNRNDLNSSAPSMNAAGGPPPFIDINQPMMTGPGSSSGSRLANDMNRLPNHYTDLSHARPEMNRNRPPPQQPPAPQQVVPPPKNASRPPNMTPPASRPPASRPVEISSSHRRQSDSGPRLTEIGQSQARLSDIGQSQGPTRMDLNRSPGRVRDSSQSQKRLTEIGQPPAPPRTRSNPTTSQSPQIINSMFYPPSFPNQVSPANQMTSPPLHHPNRRPGHPGDNMRTNCPPNFHPPPPDFNPVLNFGAGGFDPPALELNVRDTPGSGGPSSTTQPNYHPPAPPQASPRTTSKANREANRAKGNTTSSSRQSPANPPAPSKSQKSRSKSKKQAANKPYEMDTNLGNSIFESGRSMTPYFHLGGMPSPPSRNIQGEGPTYLPGNLFPGGPRPLSNANSVQHKNSEMNMNPPFNSLFQTRPQNGLGLNFQPGFGMNPMHPNHPNSPSIPPHSNSLSMPPHLSNFNLNIFSDISNPGQPDSMNISPIKFPHGNPMIPPQPGMEHNALQHHHQGAIYHNRSHPQMLHNMGLFGHGHPDLTGRSMGPAGIAQFHGHGSGPAFGMPGLNFNMHEH